MRCYAGDIVVHAVRHPAVTRLQTPTALVLQLLISVLVCRLHSPWTRTPSHPRWRAYEPCASNMKRARKCMHVALLLSCYSISWMLRRGSPLIRMLQSKRSLMVCAR